MIRWTSVATPFGRMTVLAGSSGIVRTAFDDEDFDAVLLRLDDRYGGRARRDDRFLAEARRDVTAYFAGTLRELSAAVDLSFAGNGFTRRVLEATVRVPYGELRTYGDVAAEAGSPRAWRAAGHALRVCPIELWIPCHRVVPAGPGFGTYGGHPERREFLLRLEGAI